MKRKNRNDSWGGKWLCGDDTYTGVDLNRNFDYRWGGKLIIIYLKFPILIFISTWLVNISIITIHTMGWTDSRNLINIRENLFEICKKCPTCLIRNKEN